MYLLIVMAIFWVTEALPLYITSMIPIVAFPLMGIMVCVLNFTFVTFEFHLNFITVFGENMSIVF